MPRKIFLFFIAILILFLPASGEVVVKEIAMQIPTYYTGPDDPSPPLWNLKVYPYPMQTDITRKKILKAYRVVVIENEYIKLLILPGVGGRILAALDKTNNDFDFIYHNHVVKPGLVALRGSWLSGGIEWNFPTYGHTVNTFSPVNYKILKNEDGSVTCVVGTEEWVRRMKWEVFISLFPERSYFKTHIRLYNRTLTHNNAYFWVNAATHAWEDTKVIFPPAEYTFAGGRRNPRSWPIYEGKDVSWYKNTPYAHDYFCGAPGDYNGAYNYEKENGTVHYGSRFESPGKKFWTWGTAPSGAIWEDLLTDEDGQYIEIQAGRLPTQGDTWIFEPHLVEEWDEWWYPIKKMHGFIKASPDAAVNFEIKEKGIFIALNTTKEFKGATVKLFSEKSLIFSDELDITPDEFYNKEISIEGKHGDYTLEFLDRNGQKIIDYTTARPKISSSELQPDFTKEESDSPEMHFLKGYYSMKHWNFEGAIDNFKIALKKDPEFMSAAKWLGILYYKTGKTEDALELFEKVLRRNEDEFTALYYRALCKLRLGIIEHTEEDLYMVSRRSAYRHVAPYLLASLEIRKENYEKARKLLRKVIRTNPDDIKAKTMLVAMERHLGNKNEAEKLIKEVLEDDPISPLALIEKMILTGKSELKILRAAPEFYLEVATDYSEMNLVEDAIRTLEIYTENTSAKQHPIIFYYLGYFHETFGQREEAEQYLKKAASCKPDYVFPFRVETENVLRQALKYDSTDWKAHYYLGNLLTAKLRWEEGMESFQNAAEFSPIFAVLYRNIGEIYWKKLKDYEKAEKMYEKAVSFALNEFRLFVALDELYAINKNHLERENLYKRAPKEVKKNFNYMLKRAQYFVDIEQYDKALKILRDNTFLPWEGWRGARQVYVQALLKRGNSLMEKGKYKEAIKDFSVAKTYPKNLGTGRPAYPVFARENYFIGLCYEKMGEKELAEEYFKKAAEEDTRVSSEQAYYKALALKKLGKDKEAEEILRKLDLKKLEVKK